MRVSRNLLLAAAMACSVLVLAPGQAEAKSRGTMVVLGDSISEAAFYHERGNAASTQWWRKLSRATHLTPKVYAERGSGYGMIGRKCTTDMIGDRVKAHASTLAKAKVVIVAAGVNDHHRCNADGKAEPIPDADLDAAVAQTFADLDAATDAAVYVTVPYGPRKSLAGFKSRIVRIVKAHAAEHGFTYINMAGGTLAGKRTKDGVHPIVSGSQAMYERAYYDTDMRRKYPR